MCMIAHTHISKAKKKKTKGETHVQAIICAFQGLGCQSGLKCRLGGRWWLKHVSGVPVGIEMHCWGVVGS